MINMIKHIGIQIIDNDLINFYIKILKGKIKTSFNLYPELAKEIFSIEQTIEIYHMEIKEVEFELFIYNEARIYPSFQHICLQRIDAEEIYYNAVAGDYQAYIHQKNKSKENYFIKDRMNNIFEIQNI